MRFFSALGTAFWVFLGQIFALAIAEGFGGLHIDPFGSRTALFYCTLAVSFAAGFFRFKHSSPPTPRLNKPPLAPRAVAPLDRLAKARAAETNGMVEAASRQAILFRQYFPPRHDDRLLSFFGGAPIAPRGFAWPRSTDGREGTPLHFLMQVDCASVPAPARLGALPDQGVLYFFLNLDWGEAGGHRVVHALAAGGAWESVAVPGDLGQVFGAEARHSWAWAQSQEQCPALLPKWPFEPVAIEVPPFIPQDEEEAGFPALWPDSEIVRNRIAEAQGEEVVSNSFSVRDFINGDTIRRPFPTFPHDWRAMQIWSALLVKRADDARLSSEAQAWFDRARSEPAFDAVPQVDSDAFWAFLAPHARAVRLVLTDAMNLAVESSLAASAAAAARVPSDIAARIRSRHALAVRTESGLHVNIPDRMLAAPVDIQGNQWERAKTHLLLLEVSANDGLGHRFGEGIYQFWITPEDLRAHRFDRVELTSDAY